MAKYVDLTAPSLDLLALSRKTDLRPEAQHIHFNWSFPRTLGDFQYLAELPNR